jgi:hypothetical protein
LLTLGKIARIQAAATLNAVCMLPVQGCGGVLRPYGIRYRLRLVTRKPAAGPATFLGLLFQAEAG